MRTLKQVAHKKVDNAIRRGELVPAPCEVCGAARSVGGRANDAHHRFGYGEPLRVVWLCRLHHSREHCVFPEGATRIQVRELMGTGMTKAAMARLLGVSRNRILQIVHRLETGERLATRYERRRAA